jgi:hypothetical protein
MFTADQAIRALLSQTLIRIRTSVVASTRLLDVLGEEMNDIMNSTEDIVGPIGAVAPSRIKALLDNFRTALLAELGVADFYAVSAKGAFDTTKLAEEGITAFHPDLGTKVPSAIFDAKQAARCIAFDLPTAAAFHLHRMNEEVMRVYYDTVTGGKPRPEHRNIGAYIDAMKNHHVQVNKPDAKAVYGILAMIKDHHRNPILHPDDRLEDVEDAIALLGIIRTACGLMLKEISPPPLVLEPSPNPALTAPASVPALSAPAKTADESGAQAGESKDDD